MQTILPEMTEVASTNLQSIGYDDSSLFVRFRDNNLVYRFPDVPRIVWEGLCRAESKGKFFNAYIRNQYEYEKVESL